MVGVDKRPPPLPERDKSCTREAWRTRRYGSVRVLRRPMLAPATQPVDNVKSAGERDNGVPIQESPLPSCENNLPVVNVTSLASECPTQDTHNGIEPVRREAHPTQGTIVAPLVDVTKEDNGSPPSSDWTKSLRKPRRHTKDERARKRKKRQPHRLTKDERARMHHKKRAAKRASNKGQTGTDPCSSSNDGVSYEVPIVEEPLRDDDGNVCLLTTSHYIVSGSVGLQPSAMRPFHIAFDTGSGYNVIRLSDLPDG